MSLRVWLPLNGDLENKGLDEIIFTSTTVSGYEVGKIGQAIKLLGTNIVFTAPSLEGITKFSIAFWFKSKSNSSITTNWNNVIAINSSNANESVTTEWRFESSYANSYILSAHNNTGEPIMTGTYSLVPERDKWYHIVATCDGESLIKFYVNGEHINSDRTYLGGHLKSLVKIANQSADPDVLLNDVRIYDHCLSLKQVQQIAKGLVLHYKLDNDGMGGQNLLLNSKLDGSWEYPTTSYKDKYSPITVSIPNGDVYTLSFDAKSTVNGDKIRTHYYSPNTTTRCISSQGVSGTGSDGYMNFTLSTSWQRYWVIYNQSETTAVKHVICPRLQSGQGTGIVSVKNVKLEKGSIPTPWCPAKSELIDSNIIYDSSGYQNNGTIIGNIQPVNNSPKYITAMHFLATTQKILIQNLITAGFSNSYTFSWWGKTNTFSGKMFWGFADGIRLNGIYNGNLWNTGDGSNNPIYKPGTTTQVTVPSLNTWHHFVMVGNGTSCLVYLDGELWGQAKTYKSISGTKIYFNGWDSGASYTTDDMAMSDFRIYATALSAEDIKELYQTSALIDRNQNLYVGEVIE